VQRAATCPCHKLALHPCAAARHPASAEHIYNTAQLPGGNGSALRGNITIAGLLWAVRGRCLPAGASVPAVLQGREGLRCACLAAIVEAPCQLHHANSHFPLSCYCYCLLPRLLATSLCCWPPPTTTWPPPMPSKALPTSPAATALLKVAAAPSTRTWMLRRACRCSGLIQLRIHRCRPADQREVLWRQAAIAAATDTESKHLRRAC